MEIARAGWVFRLSSVLRRWKRAWLVLYQNGHLAYFESPDKFQPEEIIVLPGRLGALHRAGNITNSPAPPEGRTVDSFLQLIANDGEEILLISADNGDDAAAWHIALDQARVARAATAPVAYQSGQQRYYAPPPGYAYPGGPQVTYAQQPPTTIIIERDPYYYGYPGYYYDPLFGVGTGAMTGLALGSMMGMGMGMGFHHHHCWW